MLNRDETLEDVVVGELLAYEGRLGARGITKARVTRVTKTLIIVGSNRFRKKFGRQVGVGTWDAGCIYPLTPEREAQIEKAAAAAQERDDRYAFRAAADKQCFDAPIEDIRKCLAILKSGSE